MRQRRKDNERRWSASERRRNASRKKTSSGTKRRSAIRRKRRSRRGRNGGKSNVKQWKKRQANVDAIKRYYDEYAGLIGETPKESNEQLKKILEQSAERNWQLAVEDKEWDQVWSVEVHRQQDASAAVATVAEKKTGAPQSKEDEV